MADNGQSKPPKDFNAMIKQCADKAYSFAFRLSGNEQDARDLVQEAFTKALKHIGDYDEGRPFEPWLNKILKNIFLDRVRRYEHKHTVTLDAPSPIDEDMKWESILPGSDASPEEEFEKKETSELIQKALNSIPSTYRMAVILCDIEQYSYQQISELLECPIGTVRSRIHQGRLMMKKAFEAFQWGQKYANIQ